ncbi:hypothetical protein TNCV_4916101 [Trichonephila clavipes]|nr:hypothetical protein TNCV_4916101 [Trichonephila clavipes]
MVAEGLARHYMTVTAVDELWHRVEAFMGICTCTCPPILFDSIPRHISAVFTARDGYSGCCFLRIYAPKLLKI